MDSATYRRDCQQRKFCAHPVAPEWEVSAVGKMIVEDFGADLREERYALVFVRTWYLIPHLGPRRPSLERMYQGWR